jgi:hypothetical protein
MNEDKPEDRFDKELRSVLDGDALEARFKELSADEREKHARERRKAQKQARKAERKARQRRGLRRAAWGLVAIVVVAGGGAFAYTRLAHSASPAGNAPSLPALSPDLQSGPPADPFQGTPADKWADGAAGITIPAAKAVGPYSAAQVAAAYQTTKKLLIAANMNQQTLAGGAPTAFADLLGTKKQRTQFLDGLSAKGLAKDQRPNSTRIMVVSFAPGTTQLIGSVIKVHGTMSAHAITNSGSPQLDIDVNYVFVYPIEPPGRPSDWMRFFASDYDSYDFAQFDDPGGPLEAWDQTVVGTDGAICYTTDGYDHPDYPSIRVQNPKGSGKPVDPYAPGTASPDSGNPVCGTSTRD